MRCLLCSTQRSKLWQCLPFACLRWRSIGGQSWTCIIFVWWSGALSLRNRTGRRLLSLNRWYYCCCRCCCVARKRILRRIVEWKWQLCSRRCTPRGTWSWIGRPPRSCSWETDRSWSARRAWVWSLDSRWDSDIRRAPTASWPPCCRLVWRISEWSWTSRDRRRSDRVKCSTIDRWTFAVCRWGIGRSDRLWEDLCVCCRMTRWAPSWPLSLSLPCRVLLWSSLSVCLQQKQHRIETTGENKI